VSQDCRFHSQCLISLLPSLPFLSSYIDAHQSEYVPLKDRRREYVSGFTGSAGTAVVTPDKALLWTDGRYFLQVREGGREGGKEGGRK
jgi:hypothetical protein